MKESNEYENLVKFITSNMGSVWCKSDPTYGRKAYTLNIHSTEVDPFKLILDYFKKNTLPKLENCGTYHAIDNKGNWYYIGSDGQWSGMSSLEKYWKNEGRKEVLAELEADEQFEGDCIRDACMEEEKEDFEAYVREIVIDAFENNKDDIHNIVCGN